MKTQELVMKVGMGKPVNNDLIFNFHFTVQHENTAPSCWVRALSYAQLNKVDSQITANTDKINHTVFPNLSNDEIKRFIETICGETTTTTSQFTMTNLSVNIINNETMNSRLLKVMTLTKLIEDWMHVIIMRLHVMPSNVIRDILHLTCLPYGPYGPQSKEDQLRNLPTKKPGHEKSEQLMIANLIEYERKLESSCPPLLKVSVTRSGVSQGGKLLYKVLTCLPNL